MLYCKGLSILIVALPTYFCIVITTVLVGKPFLIVQINCIDQHTALKHFHLEKLNKMNDLNEVTATLKRIETYTLLGAKNVFSVEDVALLTGLSKSWIYQATCNKQIPHYKPNGKQIYFDRAELEDWMKQNRVATAKEIDQKATSYVVTGKKGGAR